MKLYKNKFKHLDLIEVDGFFHYLNWWRPYLYKPYHMAHLVKEYPIMHEMLSKCCNIIVVCKNDESAPKIVLETMKSFLF